MVPAAARNIIRYRSQQHHMLSQRYHDIDVSIIMPVFNAEKWVDSCMKSISAQTSFTSNIKIEIVVYNDGSTDNTSSLLQNWKNYFNQRGIDFIITGLKVTRGVGAAKNGAVKSSRGKFLCFQDIDDVMHPDRINLQLNKAQANKDAIIGCQISRIPTDSTPRLVRWANGLSHNQLKLQIYTSNGPTLLMPTWFCHKSVYEKVGGFDESGHGTPEDLIFFYAHLDAGGDLERVDEQLLIYTYHEGATTFSVKRERIFRIQLERLEKCVLPGWDHFTIWNAGKAGRKLVRGMSTAARRKITAFCDVDRKKIGRTVDLYCPMKRCNIISLPVVHYVEAVPPLLICVKLDLTKGEFEKNLKSLNLIEGKDYIFFS